MVNLGKRILIDLDGVLNEYCGKYDRHKIPKTKVNAEDFLKELEKDTNLYLFTTRNISLAKKWLIQNSKLTYILRIEQSDSTGTLKQH